MAGPSAEATPLESSVAGTRPGVPQAAAAAVRPLVRNPLGWALAAFVVALALDGGGYSLSSRNSVAIALWWGIGLTLVLGLLPRTRIPRAALITGGLIAGFAVWTALSSAWAPSAEAVTEEANRVVLYLGVFVLAVIAARRGTASSWADGLAIGISVVGVLALASRLIPGLGLQGDVSAFFPGGVTYLSWPVNYWNGLATLVALGLPLLLRLAITDRALVRGFALGAFPAMAGVIYLTSSRGGGAAAVLGLVLFLALTPNRLTAAATLATGLVGGAAAMLVLNARNELVNGPFTSSAAVSQGRSAAILIVAICLITGVAGAFVGRLRPQAPTLGRRARWALVAGLVVVVVLGVVAAHPGQKFSDFKSAPTQALSQQTTTVDTASSHLFSTGGSGRWQFWSAALDQFGHHPLLGGGAGSYEAWWAQHGSISYFTRHAHSLFLETMGTLGIVGLLLLLSMFFVPIRSAVQRLRTGDRTTIAALLAGLGAYLVAAALDWMWELTVVTVVAIVLIALLTGPATEPAQAAEAAEAAPDEAATGPRRWRRHPAVLGGIAAVSLLFVLAQAAPLFGEQKLRSSERALQRGDTAAALRDARSAHSLEPWAASPHLQLALAYQSAGKLALAGTEIRRAISSDPSDWRLWIVSAHIAQAAGSQQAAQASLARARALDPRDPLFSGAGGKASATPPSASASAPAATADISSVGTPAAARTTAPAAGGASANAAPPASPTAPTPTGGNAVAAAFHPATTSAPAAAVASTPPSHPLITAFADDFTGASGVLGLQRARAAGALSVRLYVDWSSVAPDGPQKPAGFDASDPADPAYHWADVDQQVRDAVARGLTPIIGFEKAPRWAEGSSAGLSQGDSIPGTVRPNAADFGQFAQAAAERYSGSFGGLPRVAYWVPWNEPNHHLSLNPQFNLRGNQTPTPTDPIASVEIYRALLNSFAASVHAVHPDNMVIGGALAPFFRADAGGHASAPLTFMRQLLCIDANDRPISGCNGTADFDIWSTHPYTSGDPTHKANSPYDVSLGNLPEVRKVLSVAQSSGHIVSSRPVQFWIGEFSWDSKPPDPYGVPAKLENRWVAETLYRVWTDGVNLLAWFQVTDSPDPAQFQSGLYYACPQGSQCDKPKTALTAFRFPFVAYKKGKRSVTFWGRTPAGRPGTVVVEQQVKHKWRRRLRIRTDQFGIFRGKLTRKGSGDLRAIGLGDASLPFSLKVPPDYPVNPFGHSPPNEPAKP